MDTVVHFVFPLIIALGAKIHIKHGIRWVIVLAALTALIDIDHLFGPYKGVLHNIFLVVLLPVILIVLAFKYEKEGIKWKFVSITSLLFFSSHILLDMFDPIGVKLFYPFSTSIISFSQTVFSVNVFGFTGTVLGSGGIAIILFLCVLSLCYFLEEIVVIMQEYHEGFTRALGHATYNVEKEIKEDL